METCQALASGMATVCCDFVGFRRQVVEENLQAALPELSADERRRLAWRMWEHLFLLVVEVAHAPRKIHETNWREFVRFKNSDVLAGLLLAERPLVLVSAHFGNFEMAGFLLGILGFPTYAVARTLDNPYVDRFVNRFRAAKGQHMIPKKGGYEQIVQVLESAGKMTFLADQYAGSKGCWVNFFGRPASAHKAIALFALNHDAPLAVGYGQRLDRPLHFELGLQSVLDPREESEEANSVPRLTQWYTTQLEGIVRQAPEQYWWVHRRWKDNRPARRRAKAA